MKIHTKKHEKISIIKIMKKILNDKNFSLFSSNEKSIYKTK